MIFHTLGHQDELNAAIGIASEHCILSKNGLQPMLGEIQSRLFDLGAAVATLFTRADGAPLGNIQMLGKISGTMMAADTPIPKMLATWIARRSVDILAMSEDLPNPESRVLLRGDQIVLDWRRSNWEAHLMLVAKLKSSLRRAGYPIVLSRAFDKRTPSHQCGTARMGNDPSASVVDGFCRSHDHANLFIVDASVLPTSAAVNPALTIAALALRTARHIQQAHP